MDESGERAWAKEEAARGQREGGDGEGKGKGGGLPIFGWVRRLNGWKFGWVRWGGYEGWKGDRLGGVRRLGG